MKDCEFCYLKEKYNKDFGEVVVFWCKKTDDECNVIEEENRLKCGIRKGDIK